MENSIKKVQKFDSFDDQTHQNFLKRSSRFLKIEEVRIGTDEERELKKKKNLKISYMIAYIKVNVEKILGNKVQEKIF